MRVGPLAARADVSNKTVRSYEAIGLLPNPLRAPNGYRCSTEAVHARVRLIRRAQAADLSLQPGGIA